MYVCNSWEEKNTMAQLAIYIDDQLAKRLDKAVAASGKSKSKWVAEAIKHSLQDQWPEGFFDLAGNWAHDDESDNNEENLKLLREGVAEMEVAILKSRKNRADVKL
jgi:predicted DNA-binding protein